jgi:hypothetical protein
LGLLALPAAPNASLKRQRSHIENARHRPELRTELKIGWRLRARLSAPAATSLDPEGNDWEFVQYFSAKPAERNHYEFVA